jgi:hypothetical protein
MLRTTKLTVRLPAKLHRQLEKHARSTNQSLNALIVEAIRRGLTQAPAPESERERTLRILREEGLLHEFGPHWDTFAGPDPDMTPAELREKLAGVPPLSEVILENRGPR